MKAHNVMILPKLATLLHACGIALALCWLTPSLAGQTIILTDQIPDLEKKDWKKNPDINSVLTLELNNTDLALAQPNLQEEDKAMYLAYKRIVQEIQTNVGGTTDQSLILSFKKLMQDYPKDPTIKSLPVDGLIVLVQGLVESLTAAPVMDEQRF